MLIKKPSQKIFEKHSHVKGSIVTYDKNTTFLLNQNLDIKFLHNGSYQAVALLSARDRALATGLTSFTAGQTVTLLTGKKITFPDHVSMEFLDNKSLQVVQDTMISGTVNHAGPTIVNYPRNTKITLLAPAGFKFLQKTGLTVFNPIYTNPRIFEVQSHSNYPLLTNEKILLNLPENVYIFHLDAVSFKVERLSENTLVASHIEDFSTLLVPCHAACNSCSGKTFKECLSCYNNFYLLDGVCHCP